MTLELTLQRSDKLEETMLGLLESATYDASDRTRISFNMCNIALGHAISLRILIASGNPTSAIVLLRSQFEAVARAIWLVWVASEVNVAKLTAPLTLESEKAANNLPSLSEMLRQISISKTAPPAASQMLARFKDVSWGAMNSFVHGGIHPLKRHDEGYSLPMLIQVLQSSNGLSTMAGMLLANLSGDTQIIMPMSKIQPDFEDCLPPSLR